MELNNSKGKYLKIAVIVVAMVNSFFGFSQGPDPTKTDYKRFIPMNPEAKGFHEYGKFMVNSAKGLPDIKIPLFNLELDDVSVPISLTYNASGVKVHDLNGIVGVNWNLLAGGMIYRNIVGRPDEMEDIGWFVNPEPVDIGSWRFSPETHQAELQVFSKNITDNQPDQFGYSFGGKSGAFFFKRNTTELVKKDRDPILIKRTRVDDSQNGDYLYFEIKDEKGNQYFFGQEKSSREKDSIVVQTLGNMDVNRSGEGDTGWKLEKIITNRGNIIQFNYIVYEVDNVSYVASQRHVKYNVHSNYNNGPSIEPTSTLNKYRNCLISSIESSSFKVDFVYKEFGTGFKWDKVLDSVMFSVPGLDLSKGYKLDYINCWSGKLYLQSIDELGRDSSALGAPYVFNYDDECSAPDIQSYSQDYFGYNNGADNTASGLHYNGILLYWPRYITEDTLVPRADRNVYFEHLKKGTLQEIRYPTGGSTKFVFEPNYECDPASQDTFFASGLRLRYTFDIDKDGNYYNGKQYRYSGLTGYRLRQGPNPDSSGFVSKYADGGSDEHGTRYVIYSDDPKIKNMDTVDFYYKNIEECHIEITSPIEESPDPIIKGKISYAYDAAQDGTSYNTFLTKQTFEKIIAEDPCKVKEIVNTYFPHTKYGLPYYIMNDSYIENTSNERSFMDGLILKTINYSNPQLDMQQIYEYSDEGPDTMYTENWYTYDDSTGLLKEKIEDKTGRNIKTEYHYPFNYANSKYPYNRMTEKNMLSQAIEQVRYVNGGAVDSRLTTYQKFGDYYLPDKSYTFNAQTPYSFVPFEGDTIGEYYDVNNPDVEILAYSQGKPKKIKTRDGLYTYYFWDSDYTHIVAKATSELSSVYPFVLDASYAEGVSEINDMVADIKMSLYSLVSNKDIQVTIYTYNRSMGLSSQTDPNGLTGYYEHDGFNRLIRIRDNNGNILQEYDYNYSNQ